jgi:2'-5' RNA ligase
MPYKLDGTTVVNAATGQVVKRHSSRRRALAHLRALYANVPEARRAKTATKEHSGVIVALWLELQQANPLSALVHASQAGPWAESSSDYHITLCYLGQADALTSLRPAIEEALQDLAAGVPSALVGKVSGIGRFTNDEGNRTNALYASFDCPELPAIRQQLLERLGAAGVPPEETHGFTPHITLAYIPAAMPTPDIALPPFEISFIQLVLCWGDERTGYPLGALAIAEKAANYSARAGQNISRGLKRGNDGKFTSAGAGGSTVEQESRRIVDAQAKKPKPTKPAKGASRRGRATARRRAATPKKPAGQTEKQRLAAERARERLIQRQQRADHQARQRDIKRGEQAKRKVERDEEQKKRKLATAQRRAAVEARRRQRAQQQAGKGGGGKGGGKAKPAREQVVRDNRAKVMTAIAGNGINADAASALFAFADGGTADPEMLQAIADELGLLTKDNQGKYRLSVEGRSFVNAADRGDLRRAQDALSKAQDRLAGQQTATKEASGLLTVYKDARGQLRWLGVSSTAFKDIAREIVSTAALERDIARTYATGQHGPLRFWHVGDPERGTPAEPWGPGLDIGDCDFRMLAGRSLVESGTLRKPEYARLVKNDDQMSLGFRYFPSGLTQDGVFNTIFSFERSITPARRASNPLTWIAVKERPMHIPEEKKVEYKDRGGDMELLEQMLEGQEVREKAAESAGIAYKELPAELLTSLEASSPELAARLKEWMDTQAEETPVTEEPTAIVEKDDDAGEMADAAGADAVVDDGPLFNDGDLNILRGLIREEMAPMLGALDIEKKMGGMMQELKSLFGGVREKEIGEITALKEAQDTLQQQLGQVNSQLELLMDGQPSAIARKLGGYRASQDTATARIPERVQESLQRTKELREQEAEDIGDPDEDSPFAPHLKGIKAALKQN